MHPLSSPPSAPNDAVPTLLIAGEETSPDSDGAERGVSTSRLADLVVIGLRSSDCWSVWIPRSRFKRLPSAEVLAFDLEEWLPCDADSMAAAALPSADGWLLVAVDAERCQDLAQRIEGAGKFPLAVCPLAFLAWADLCKQDRVESADVVIWQSEDGLDLLRLQEGQVVDWRWADANGEALEQVLSSWADDAKQLRYIAVDCERVLVERLLPAHEVQEMSLGLREAAATTADQVVQGRMQAPLDLRTGPLLPAHPLRPISGPLNLFVASVLLLLCMVTLATFSRAWRYRAAAQEAIAAQEEIFREVFPSQRVPVGIRSRLESEHRRLLGTRGIGSTPRVGSVVPVLHATLSAFPPTARCQVDRLELLPGQISLISGTARSYGEVEKITSSMKRAGFNLPPVSASQVANGVTLRLENVAHDASNVTGPHPSAMGKREGAQKQ